MSLASLLASRLRLAGTRTRGFGYCSQHPASHFFAPRRRLSEIAKTETGEGGANSTSFSAKELPKAEIGELSAKSSSFSSLERHGKGDGVLRLNVGGKEFVTLRSTVNINPVLRDHVLRAERNKEFTHGGEAVFIDRDPAQFGLVLQHLRNVASGLDKKRSGAAKAALHTKASVRDIFRRFRTSSSSELHGNMKKWKKSSTLIQIPEDRATMRELFVEARHFQIKELEDVLCKRDLFIQFSSFMGSGTNPFQEASQLLSNVRRALLATSGVGIFVGRESLGDMVNDARHFVMGTTPEKNDKLDRKDGNQEPLTPSLA